MKNNLRLRAMGVTVLALCALISSGCKQGGAGRTEVKECSTHNNDEAACDNAKTTKGVKCYYANQTCSEVPSPQQATGACVDLSSHKDKCESRMDCKYTNNTCEDAKPAACDNVKLEDACKNVFQAFCAWDATAKKCQAKRNQGLTTDIYKWKKLSLPTADTTPDELQSFVVSKDNQQLYVLGNHNNQQGLYHSADGGVTWVRLGANNGDLTMTPKQNAVATTIAVGQGINNIELKPTVSGVVVFLPGNPSKIISIDGATLKWGLESPSHAGNAAQANDRVANVIDQNIKFVDVSPDGTIVYFGYEADNSTYGKYSQLLASANGGSGAGIAVTTKQVHDTLDQPLLTQEWSRIGFSETGDMLLFSDGQTLGVYRIAQAELANAAQGHPRLVADERVLFPENGQAWDDAHLRVLALYAHHKNINGNPTDVHMAVVKDANNAYHYVARYAGVQGTGGDTIGGAAGQQPGHASRSYNAKYGVDFTTYGGILRLVTALGGILGLKDDGSEDYLRSYSLGFINAKTEMMDDGSDVTELNIDQNSQIQAIYGDDSLTYYLIAGMKGMWSRTAEQGQPRP